jgi:O-antigen ligase
MKGKIALALFLKLYILTLAFQSLVYLPVLEHRIQISEWVFLILLSLIILQLRSIRPKLNALDLTVIAYLLVNVISPLFTDWTSDSVLEVLGRLYLIMMYFIVKFVIVGSTQDENIKALRSAFLALGFISSLIAITGWIVANLEGDSNVAARLYMDYPYFGDIFRATGFTSSPTMLILLLSYPCLIAAEMWKESGWKNGKHLLAFLIILLTAVLTFSKTLILLVAVVINLLVGKQMSLKLRSLILFFAVLFYIGVTHLLIFPQGSDWNERMKDAPFTTNEILYENEQVMIVESFYLFSKKCALNIAKSNCWVGIGPGKFYKAVENLNDEDIPGLAKFGGFDPHSTYFGGLAETGVIGLASIFLLVIVSLKYAWRIVRLNVRWNGLLIVLMLFVIQGATTDTMNMRILWVILGIVSGMSPRELKSK